MQIICYDIILIPLSALTIFIIVELTKGFWTLNKNKNRLLTIILFILVIIWVCCLAIAINHQCSARTNAQEVTHNREILVGELNDSNVENKEEIVKKIESFNKEARKIDDAYNTIFGPLFYPKILVEAYRPILLDDMSD